MTPPLHSPQGLLDSPQSLLDPPQPLFDPPQPSLQSLLESPQPFCSFSTHGHIASSLNQSQSAPSPSTCLIVITWS